MDEGKVLGLVGWSGAGKTTLLVKLIPLFTAQGLKVSTLKHAHHEFDIDVPGKDSYEHRRAGASEVIVSSDRRWAHLHENNGEAPATLADLLKRLSPCDLVLVEGFKSQPHPKLEVWRAAVGKPPIHPDDPHVVALTTDGLYADAGLPWADINDAEAVARLVLERAEPLSVVLAKV